MALREGEMARGRYCHGLEHPSGIYKVIGRLIKYLIYIKKNSGITEAGSWHQSAGSGELSHLSAGTGTGYETNVEKTTTTFESKC